MNKCLATLVLLIFLALPCLSEGFTLGMVQQRIRTGMPQSEVLACFGAPSVVMKCAEGQETWEYDKISQDVNEPKTKNWFLQLIAKKRKCCQKTITVVLNFDQNACLETFMYKSRAY